MRIQLSDHFSYRKLILFTLPSIGMMIFTSIYGVVDGFFVSNFAGKTPFAAVNFIMPFLMILGTFGFMFGAGGSALISKTLGEGKRDEANRLFSMVIWVTVGFGIVLALLGIVLARPIAEWLGATGEMVELCALYGSIILTALPFFMLQMEFQTFFVTAELPQLGFFVTLASGVANIILDALLVWLVPSWFGLEDVWNLVGAAVATAVSQIVGGVVPLLYFARPNKSLLRLGKPYFDGRAFLRICTNGSSELMSNISMSLVSMLYNVQLMHYAGEDGVAAYGVLMYVCMIFLAVFIGYSIGTAPVVGYHYGAENHGELHSLLKKSLLLVGGFSVVMLILGEVLALPLSMLFVGYEPALFDITLRGFLIFSFSFLFSGFAIFGSGFFTALNNGPVSAVISFLRTLGFQVAAVLLLPMWLGLDGIWLSIVVAEVMAVAVTAVFLFALRKKYHY